LQDEWNRTHNFRARHSGLRVAHVQNPGIGFASGHSFSRAAELDKIDAALAAEVNV
jgi:hypothetical protein